MPAFTLYIMLGLVAVIVALTLLLREEPPATPVTRSATAPAERSPHRRIRRQRVEDRAAVPTVSHRG